MMNHANLLNLIWSAPLLIFAAIVIGWAAETAQVFISQGLALAVLAWLQTAPEMSVEALIAWEQKQNLMIANLTGSLRLLVGLGWPLIFFTQYFFGKSARKTKALKLPAANTLEIVILTLCAIYFLVIWFKGTLILFDAAVLLGIYFFYVLELLIQSRRSAVAEKAKREEEPHDTLPWVTKYILKIRSRPLKAWSVASLFVLGGVMLLSSTKPFLQGLESLALIAGISSFFFVQWVAPFVSEFPEKVTALQWARTGKKAGLALHNMISSTIVQWTVMAALISVVYSISRHAPSVIHFNFQQREEILLTVAQSFLGILLLMDLELSFFDALLLLVLWATQFCIPSLRPQVTILYGIWAVVEIIWLSLRKKLFFVFFEYRRQKILGRSKNHTSS